MYARVTKFRVQEGKVDEFQHTVQSMIPIAHKQKGFRGMLILRGSVEAPREGHVITLWDSLEDLRSSEKSLFFYDALARLMRCCEGFPVILEQEVLCSEFQAA